MGTLTVNDNLPQFSIYPYTFPNVEIVTGLPIRRQFYRKITAKSLDKLLREIFTCLRWFNHEVWYNVDLPQQFHFEKGMLGSHSLLDIVVRQKSLTAPQTNSLLQTTRGYFYMASQALCANHIYLRTSTRFSTQNSSNSSLT